MNEYKVKLTSPSSHNTPFHRVDIGPITLYFSYETCVAFWVDGHSLVVCENIWSTTTGRHLGELDGGGANKKNRVPYAEFDRQLKQVIDMIHVEEAS
jgi:hypothetical protein